jgi:hypothetical protein
VNCSARGPASAAVEDRQFLQQVMTAAGVTLAELTDPAAWRRLAPEISRIAIDWGIAAEPGTAIDLVATAGADTVGRGQLTVLSTPTTIPAAKSTETYEAQEGR